MKARPIIFSADMVRALLDGRKTQTRRVVKLPSDATHVRPAVGAEARRGAYVAYWLEPDGTEGGGTVLRCPYGRPGDLLWVRETHRFLDFEMHGERASYGVYYQADKRLGLRRNEGPVDEVSAVSMLSRSPIHMPRWASRLTLLITDVRVQRVQDISKDEAVAEGVRVSPLHIGIDFDGPPIESETIHWVPSDYFAALWDALNAKRGHGWGANPWVWALTFDVIEKNVDEVA